MEKIYGYKEKDLIALARYIADNESATLSETFKKFAILSGKAKGTVRNLYYALAKLSRTDEDFREKYLGGKTLSVNTSVVFNKSEERALVKNVFLKIQSGKSVRKSISELARGDEKLALRFQNKYRSILKNNPALVAEVVEEIKSETGNPVVIKRYKTAESAAQRARTDKLKNEINAMVERISLNLRRENALLKLRVKKLETENLRLGAMLFGDKKRGALKFFSNDGDNGMTN